MKKLLLIMCIFGFSLSFSACEDDSLKEIQPEFDLPDVRLTDGENEGTGGVNQAKK